jgi:ABC-type transporter Mla MlaB component
MALFSKSVPKKPAHPDANARQAKRNAPSPAAPVKPTYVSASPGVTITGFGLVDWSPTRRKIEVTQGQPGLCPVLENAVLLYASGHGDQALALLSRGVHDEEETRSSQLAWLALFDLLQRAGDRAAFEQLALDYVVYFERSAPAWDETVRPTVGPRATSGGYVAMTGKLSAGSRAQLDMLRKAIARKGSQSRLDLSAVNDFDDTGARALAMVLGEARRRQYALELQRADALRRALDTAVKHGAAGGEGAWLLLLELLQWQNDRATFDERAVDYAVTFEVSPPSWEPPNVASQSGDAGADAQAAAQSDALLPGIELVACSGVIAGSSPAQVGAVAEYAQDREMVYIDLRQVERIDFVGAGAVLNLINKLEAQRKVVQIFGATACSSLAGPPSSSQAGAERSN